MKNKYIKTFESFNNLAPNILVRSPEFKAWFGDWENDPENSSKVVDSNGEPLVVYHGTATDFYDFKIGKTGGIFFADRKNSAEEYSVGKYKREGNNPKVLNLFLNIKKLYDKNTKDDAVVDSYYKEYFEHRPFITKASRKNILKDKYNRFFTHELVCFGMVNEEANIFLIKNGYDGIVIDGGIHFKSYIVFEPNQIKLADGSNTTFDSKNPNIIK